MTRLAAAPASRARVIAGALLLAALVAAGCGLSTTPFNPAQSCQAVGGTYAGGICHAGNG